MNITTRQLDPPGSPPRHQTGMSLLQVMLILLLLGAIVATGFQLLQSRAATTQAMQQAQALTWADQAVASFAAANSRLPCPASTPEGKEDCASGSSKGYLPIASLDTFFDHRSTSIIGASGTGKLPSPVMYAVNRASSSGTAAPYAAMAAPRLDLAQAAQRYSPPLYKADKKAYEIRPEFKMDNDTFKYDAVNGFDFCASLSQASANPALTGGLSVPVGSKGNQAIAYGVAIAGATPGNIERFDDDNLDNALSLADPGRADSANYDDRVRIRTFESLSQSVGCNLLATKAPAVGRPASVDNVPIAVMDLVADSASIDDSVKDTQQSTKDSATDAVASGKQAVAFATIAVVMAGVDVASKGIDLGEAIGLLSQNIVRCVASLGVECWRVAPSAIALGLNVASLTLSVASLAQAIASLTINSKALVEASTVLQLAQAAIDASSTNNLSEALKQAHDAAYGIGCVTTFKPEKGIKETVCEREGLKQTSEKAEATAMAQETARDAFKKKYMDSWEGDELNNRIPGWKDLDAKERASRKSSAVNALKSAQNYIDSVTTLESYQADLKTYKDQLASLKSLVGNQSKGNTQTGTDKTRCELKPTEHEKTLCRSALMQCDKEPSSVERLKCEDAALTVAYITTCIRNGVLEVFTPPITTGQSGSDSTSASAPFCIPALIDAVDYASNRVSEQTNVVSQRLVEARKAEATNIAVHLTGNVLMPVGAYVLQIRYPPDWAYCTAEMNESKSCDAIPITKDVIAPPPEQFVGGYLPLLRLGTPSRWLSYGDAYRQYTHLKANAEKARTAANLTLKQFEGAVAAYEELKGISDGGSAANGISLWIGANQTVKAADDRGTVGPDRNADNQSTVSP